MVDFECCRTPFSTITYQLELRRYSLFYYIYIFLPLVSQLFLFLIIFHISPSSGERMGFGVTILLNITMYIVLIAEKLPEKSDNQPVIGYIFVSLFYLMSVGLAISAVTMMLSGRTTRLPEFARKFFQRYSGQNCYKIKQNSKDAVRLGDIFQRTNYQATSENGKAISQNESFPNEDQVSSECSNEIHPDYGWMKFMRYVDKCLFFVFLFFLILIPIIICGSMDRTYLAV